MPGRLCIAHKKWFWNAYDHVGTLVLLNLLWVLCSLPLITVPASTAGLFYVTSRMASYQEASIRDFFLGFRRYHGRGLRLGGLYVFAFVVLFVNMRFYGRLMGSFQWIGTVLGGGMIWGMVFIGLTGVYAFPLLVQTDDPVRTIIKKSILLVLDNIRYTSVLLLGGMGVLLIGAVTGAGIVFGAVALVGLLFNTGLREVLKKYTPPKTGETPLITEVDPEEPRDWRDLIRPWEYR